MTQAELQIVIAELREQNKLNRREHALNRREHQLNRQMHEHVLCELERMDERRREESEISRRFQAETTALCTRLVSQSTAAMQEFARAMDGISRRMARVEAKVDTSVEATRDAIAESRAQRQALLRLIDRMDGLDGGASAS
jgi:hypothetical protein